MNRQEYINEVLIPAMFQRADTLFGDRLHFASYTQGWRTRTHLNGIDVDSHAKTVWRANTPFYIKDWGTGASGAPKCAKQGSGGGWNAEVVALYAEYYCGGDRNAAVDRLLEEYKLVDDYKKKVKPYAKNTDKELTQRRTDMEACDDLFRRTFEDRNNTTTQRVISYLTGRGWTVDDMEKSGVGVIDAATKAKVPQGYAARLNDLIGDRNVIAIPLRISGLVDRFHFRSLLDKDRNKYQKESSNRFSEKKQLFGTWNFVGTNIVVEGVLDYLHARAFGINVLLSEGAPTDTQIIHAAKHRVSSFTLMFDADTAGWGYTQRMGKALMVAGKDVKVASLPPLDVPEVGADGNTTTRHTWFNDLDDWLCAVNKIVERTGEPREEYVELLLEAVRNAVPYDVWRAEVLERWFVMQVLDVEPQHPDVNNITTDVVARVCRAAKNKHGELFVDRVAEILATTAGTVHASRVEVVFRKWEEGFKREAARAQEAQLKNEEPVKTPFIFDLSALQVAGGQTYQEEQTDALLDEIRGKNEGEEWANKYGVLVPQCKTWEELAVRRSKIKQGVPSMFAFPGYCKDGVVQRLQYVQFFPGLTLLCANTGHGKTSILNTVALYDAERNKVLKNNKVTLYLSFEIEEAVLMADVLNIYNNDPELSNNPADTLRSFFAEKLYNTENFADYYFNKESVPEVQADGKEVYVSHYERFVNNWHKFDTEYLTQGGHLHIARVNWCYEELLEGLTGYWERATQPDGAFAGKEISMVCVDYAQLLLSSGFSRQRTEEIKQIVQGLNNFAKDVIHAPIVMCAQFNQQVNNPAKIAINCIGEGGDFSRYADTVIGFYNLEKLTETDAGEKAVIDDLKSLGVILPNKGDGLGKKELAGLMFCRLLKTRSGSFPMDTLMLWDGKLKKLHTNCNRFVADKDFARAVHKEYNISWEELIKRGREELTDIGIRMDSIAGTRKAPDAKIETFIGALSPVVKDWEDRDPLLKGAVEGAIVFKAPEPEPTAQPGVEGDGMFYADGTPLPQDNDCPF